MKIDISEYRRACQNYEETWALTNKLLYDMCRQYPDHSTQIAINAKLWIIGRTYATGIERKIETTGEQGGSLTRLAELVYKRREAVDAVLAEISQIKEPLAADKLQTILVAHGKFIEIIAPVIRDGQTPRSFASKYLHFHCPAVPIFDNVAWTSLRALCRQNESTRAFKLPAKVDEVYYDFVLRFWQVYQQMQKIDSTVSVRSLDTYLLYLRRTA